MHGEFDHYIQGYRPNLDKALSLSGESSTFFAHYKAQKLASWLSSLRNRAITILDFGCGDGLMTHFVQQQFPQAQVHGCDPSSKSIEVAQSNFSTIHFKVSSDQECTLPYDNETFDLIFAAGSFHHIPFTMHEGYLQELRRICKKHATIVLFELNPLNPLTTYTFKHNPIDQHATMLKPWYAYRLAQQYSRCTSLKFYCFYPRLLRWLRWTEPGMTKIPFGALYAVIMSL